MAPHSRNSLHDLAAQLKRIDGANYGAYKRFQGEWIGDDVDVCIDHVQGDPFASPSLIRLRLHDAGYAPVDFQPGPTRTAICDLLLRVFADATSTAARSGSGHSGQVRVDAGGCAILRRSGCELVEGKVQLRVRVGLPARGRRVLGVAAATLLARDLPNAARAVKANKVPRSRIDAWHRVAKEHAHLAAQLSDQGLVAFIADGAILPRISGVSNQPMRDARPFEAPPSLRVQLCGIDGDRIVGLGIPVGVTVITGAGFHGKSTLLGAIAAGIHPHIPGDGREQVVTVLDALKLRSEDGRSVIGVNLCPFISSLPGAKCTAAFSTADASGSTSLAASIMEAMESGSTALLLDEDTCATNLLVRDARMQALTKIDAITPLVDRVSQLHDELGVSVVAVIGGCGDYLDVATTTIAMREYRAYDVSDQVRSLVDAMPSGRIPAHRLQDWPRAQRTITPRSLAPTGRRGGGKARGLRDLIYGGEELALDGLEQLVDESQVRFIAVLLEWMSRQSGSTTLRALAEKAVQTAHRNGLYSMRDCAELADVRAVDVISVANRLRTLKLR